MNDTDSERLPIRVFTPGGTFIGKCSLADAHRKLRNREAKLKSWTRHTLRAITDLNARVDSRIPGASLVTVQTENLGDTLSIKVLKRATPDGAFHNWDPDLTWDELRKGRMVSETTALRRIEERAFRRH